jgi:hypothetical protein
LERAKAIAEENQGVIPDDLSAELDAIEMTREQKIENVVKAYKNESALADMIKAEIKALQSRISSHESGSEWLKKWLSMFVQVGEKFEFGSGKISWRKSSSVIVDETKLPDEYFKVVRSPMKSEIKDAIKAGTTIPGALIEEKQNIQIK